MIARYYQEELHYLRELGRELAERYPEAAPFLAEPMADPSVERLLEGFAFLTGRLREKIDDELPELTVALLESFFPHYLRPVPSLTLLQFRPMPKVFSQVTRVEPGATVDSVPVDGTRCRFVTTAAVDVCPLKIEGVRLVRGTEPAIHLSLTMLQGASFGKLDQDRLRLYLIGDDLVARSLFLCLGAYLRRTEVVVDDGGESRSMRLPGRGAEAAAFRPEEQILAGEDDGRIGFNLLHEYFSFAHRFLCIDVVGLRSCHLLQDHGRFDLVFRLESMPESLPDVDERHFQLNCVPAVNLFGHHADPIHISGEQAEYPLRPTDAAGGHFQLHAVSSVIALLGEGRAPRRYVPLFRYAIRDHEDACFYALSQQPSLRSGQIDHRLTLQHGPAIDDQAIDATLSIGLRCTNGRLPESLDVGDVSRVVAGVPAELRVRNIDKPTAAVPPPVAGDALWRLLGLLHANGASLASVESLRSLINLFNFRGHHQRHARQAGQRLQEAVQAVSSRPERRLHQGVLISGTLIEIRLDDEGFPSAGEMYLFSCVLAELFAEFVTLNSFVRLEVQGIRSGERFSWPARLGRRWTV